MKQQEEAAEEFDTEVLKQALHLAESGELDELLKRLKTSMPPEDYKTFKQGTDWLVQFFDAAKDENVTADELRERFLPPQG